MDFLVRRHFRRLLSATVDGFRAAVHAGGILVHRLADGMAQNLEHPTAEGEHSRGLAVFHKGDAVAGDAVSGLEPDEARRLIDFVLARLPPKGDPALPENIGALGLLLADELPARDFVAVDLLHACFPRGTRNSSSRLLMAVARNITRNFGRQGRLPIASGKAWAMLDPDLFNDEMAAQMAAICAFVLDWQAAKQSFLILDFPEIELIEYLFENLHPRRHASLMLKVMDFKVLSSRRAGLLRRIPSRMRRFAANPEGRSLAQVRAYVEDTIELLSAMAQPHNFAAVVAAAQQTLVEIEKISAQLANPAAAGQLPAPPGGGPQPPGMPGALSPAAAAAPPELHPLMRGLATPAAVPPLSGEGHAASTLPLAAPGVAPRKRFTRQQKTEAVLRVIQGEDRGWVALSLGIRPDLLDRWQKAFLDGGSTALSAPSGKEAGESDGSIEDLKGKLQDLIRTVETLSAQIAKAPGPDDGTAAPSSPPPSPPSHLSPELAAKPLPPGGTPPRSPRRRKNKNS